MGKQTDIGRIGKSREKFTFLNTVFDFFGLELLEAVIANIPTLGIGKHFEHSVMPKDGTPNRDGE